ncbi:MAG TPA: hypothetical protein VIW29_17520 [Polyangiaceae bacterium]
MHGVTRSLLLVALALTGGCTPHPPPRWAEGGAPLAFGPARWEHDGDAVEIQPDGRVLVDGDLRFVLDRVGRVANDDYDPYAVLLPDGQLAGVDNATLGRLGVTNASPPGAVAAWLAVMPDGQVVYFSTDGDRASGGAWKGCTGPILRTCTLVTHLLAVANYAAPSSGVSVGVGVGVGFGY